MLACKGETSEIPIEPFTNGFTGTITREDGFIIYKGIASTYKERWKEGSKSGPIIQITELPPQTWTNNVKESLEKHDWVYEVVTHSKDETVDLRVCVTDDASMETAYKQIEKILIKRVSTKNMNMFNDSGMLKNYSSPEEIISDHAMFKLKICTKRLEHMIANKLKELNEADAKYKYIQLVLSDKIKIMNVKRDDLKQQILENNLGDHTSELLKMLLTSLTEEESTKLKNKYEELEKEIEELKTKKPFDLWEQDLNALKEELSEYNESMKRKISSFEESESKKKKPN